MKCLACGGAHLVKETRDVKYTYKGESTVIPKVRGDYCPKCGDSIHDQRESARINELMLDFNKQVNGTMVDPAFITAVRKKLKLDQRAAAQIFGGGVNAFSRYENGKTRPPLALVRLLQILNRHPELLIELQIDLSLNP